MVNIGVKRLRHLREKPTLSDDNRASFTDDKWKGVRGKFIGQTTAGGIAFLLLFLACLTYLYGTLYRSTHRTEHLHILAVDYDGGVVGEALKSAYEQLKGAKFFTLEYHTPEEYPTEEDMYHAVWKGSFWGAISVTQGISRRLESAIQGTSAASYNPEDAIHYIWNQQPYTAISNSAIQPHMQQLVMATRIAYNKMNGTQASQILNNSIPAAVQVLLNPIASTERNISPAPFGTVMLLNTVSMAMPVLQQFFFLLVLNGTSREHHIYDKMTVRSSLLVRRIAGLIFTFGASLCQTGYFWAFREEWDVNGNQFVLTWMTFWLLMQIHYLIMDTISTISPLPVMPFVVLIWIFINIASTLSPLEVQAGFFHWGIALPSHNAYSVLLTIWTGGALNRLHRALPILFSWWFVGNITASISHWRACHLAYKLHEESILGLEKPYVKDVDDQLGHLRNNGNRPSYARNSGIRNSAIRNSGFSIELWRIPTPDAADTSLELKRSLEEAILEQRLVYGPSIPSFL